MFVFDTETDWEAVSHIFDLKTVAEIDPKARGAVKSRNEGLGRVLRGSELLRKLHERND